MALDVKKINEVLDKELMAMTEKGLNANTLQNFKTLAEARKDLSTIAAMEQGGYDMPRYRDDYRDYSGYRDGGNYGRRGGNYRDDYDRGGYNNYGTYRGQDMRMRDHMDRIMDGAESYEYGRDRYMHGGDEARLQDGIEKLMYAICTFVESTMEFAETPQEKETIRRHLQKLSKL